MKRALIVGCGYTGEWLATRLLESGCDVVGTTRGEERASELESLGVRPLVGKLRDGEVLRRLERFGPEIAFYLVPPTGDEGDPLLDVLAATARAPLEAFVYCSSTSVYGDCDGAWVDETDPPRPEGRSAEARLAAEHAVIGAGRDHRIPTRICRVTGIYGPGRTLERLLERGDYLLIEGRDTWVNRIHVDDLVSGLIAAWRLGRDARVYNLGDDEPHRASEFASLAARLHGLPEPEWVTPEEAAARLSSSRLRRKTTNKRVRNRRMREELKVDLRYPSFRVGLPASVISDQ